MDIIKLLPDSVANQIAAGEVIQRPASVVKELIENAIDAQATEIVIHIKDAGRTLIQVADNGKGMSETDARMAFERHATSKIAHIDDLFRIETKGFRGEALASIAAVAHVELKTRRHSEPIGTEVHVSNSKVEKQEPTSCPAGSNFVVRNLFYNVPARRKFLKSNQTEKAHILAEIERVALVHTDVKFIFVHNDEEELNLPATNIKQRIINLFGKQYNNYLLPVGIDSPLVKIDGFISKPETSRKSAGEQFFFVNKRFMKHAYFHKAISSAFGSLLPADVQPQYFIYITIDPAEIDINVHPSKTEIKFSNANSIFSILNVIVKETLGKHNIVPSIDFDQNGNWLNEIENEEVTHSHGGFEHSQHHGSQQTFTKNEFGFRTESEQVPSNWQELYSGFEFKDNTPIQSALNFGIEDTSDKDMNSGKWFQFKFKYIFTSVKTGLIAIDQKRAHQRILYDEILKTIETGSAMSQKELFPITLDLSPTDYAYFEEINDTLNMLGFDIRSFGRNTIVLQGIPAYLPISNPTGTITQMLEYFRETGQNPSNTLQEQIAWSLAKSSSIGYGQKLAPTEMQDIFDTLFASSNPNTTPDNKKIIVRISLEEFDKRFD